MYSLYFYIIFICKWISFSSLCKIVRSSVILLLPEYVLNICKCMFIYNQIMILDHKSFRKCVCDFAATLTRSNINLEFVYLCIRSKDFAPISTISYYIHWAALAVWFFVFFITSMKSGMLEVLLHTYLIFFNI
jgi:hypothetical protein